MDTDPLSDTIPPRYAVESDEEDEYNPLNQTIRKTDDVDIDIQIIGDIANGKRFLVASGQVGSYWASGADLGEQKGAVFVNKIQVGMLFTPSWTHSNVLISEATTRLPMYMMHPYAQAVLDRLGPSTVGLLDMYPHHAYITPNPIPYHDAPIRYLSTAPVAVPSVEPFSTPNLVTSTSASFMAILNLPSNSAKAKATLFLVPVPKIPQPPPKELGPSDIHMLSDDSNVWADDLMQQASNLLLEGSKAKLEWKSKSGIVKNPSKTRHAKGDGSMYI